MNSNLLSMKRWVRGIFYIVLITVALIQIYPFFWVVTSSLKTDADLARAAYLLPSEIFIGHYKEALQSDLLRYFFNSMVVAVSVLFFLVIISAPAGYALS